MNIPSILINTTVAEFNAEGYDLVACNIDAHDNGTTEQQFITLTFKKEEEKNG